jgi:hypothetical protein
VQEVDLHTLFKDVAGDFVETASHPAPAHGPAGLVAGSLCALL